MKELQVGLVGCGHISVTHLKAWAMTRGSRVRGVFDVDSERARARARSFGIPQVYEDVDQLLAECDVVDVCTPPQTHEGLIDRVLAAERHLAIEKPIVTEIGAWERIRERLAQTRTKLCVIHNLKFTHAIQTTRRWIEEGRLGEVLSLDWSFLTSPSGDRMLVGSSHWSHNLPGGRWFETLPHNLYLTHYLAGALELEGASVVPHGVAGERKPADEVLIQLGGGSTLATIRFSARCELNRRTVTITGTEGRVQIDLLADFATLSRVGDSVVSRVLGTNLLEAGLTILQAFPDRTCLRH